MASGCALREGSFFHKLVSQTSIGVNKNSLNSLHKGTPFYLNGIWKALPLSNRRARCVSVLPECCGPSIPLHPAYPNYLTEKAACFDFGPTMGQPSANCVGANQKARKHCVSRPQHTRWLPLFGHTVGSWAYIATPKGPGPIRPN